MLHLPRQSCTSPHIFTCSCGFDILFTYIPIRWHILKNIKFYIYPHICPFHMCMYVFSCITMVLYVVLFCLHILKIFLFFILAQDFCLWIQVLFVLEIRLPLFLKDSLADYKIMCSILFQHFQEVIKLAFGFQTFCWKWRF